MTGVVTVVDAQWALYGKAISPAEDRVLACSTGDLAMVNFEDAITISEKVVKERVAVVSDNTRTDSRFKGHSIVTQSVRSAMCSPLMAAGDRILGLLYVDSVTAANSFTDEDLRNLASLRRKRWRWWWRQVWWRWGW